MIDWEQVVADLLGPDAEITETGIGYVKVLADGVYLLVRSGGLTCYSLSEV